MKIALCFSGQARSFKKGYEYYARNLFPFYSVDVFIHTWEFDNSRELIDLYKPVSYIVEEPLKGDFDKIYPRAPMPEKWPPRFTLFMIYSMEKSCWLKKEHEEKNNYKYDWVIKSRTDYALNVRIPFEKLDSSKMYIPHCRMVPTRDFGNDQFAFSSSENMDKRMTIYRNRDLFYNQGVQMNGEEMMSAQLKLHGLVGKNLLYVNMNNPFPPGEHNGTPHSLIRDDYEEWKKR